MSSNTDIIFHQLRKRTRLRRLLAFTGIVLGLPLALLAPLMLGTIFWFSNMMLFSYLPWIYFLVGTAILAIPSLFLVEKRSRGAFLDEVHSNPIVDLPGGEELSQRMLVYGVLPFVSASVVTNPRIATAGFVELFLFGPRLVLNGLEHLRRSRRIPELNIRLACDLVETLLHRESGMTLDEFGGKTTDQLEFGRAILWLAFYDWIGISKEKDKVFLFSESRSMLQNDS